MTAASPATAEVPLLPVVPFGVIGGSGVYAIDGLTNVEHRIIATPFGEPSDAITIATLPDGVTRCAFLPRHHRAHKFSPSEVNYRANIFAFKLLGVKFLLSVTAVGSLRAHLRPGELVFPDQVIDRTFGRKTTFFEQGIVAHVPFGNPICTAFRAVALGATKAALPAVTVHDASATLVTMEGPQFSSKAESLMNRQFGGDLIGMTTATEAKLAREAEMAYCVVSMVTDMDAWSDEPHVDVASVVKVLHDNANNAQVFIKAIIGAVAAVAATLESEAFTALEFAVMTKRDAISKDVVQKYSPLIGRLPAFQSRE